MSTGTMLSIITFPWPWPCAIRTKIIQREPVAIFAETDGSLSVHIASNDEVVEFQTSQIVFDAQTSTNVGLSWNLPDAVALIVGKTFVLSIENSASVLTKAHITSGVPNDVRDFSQENQNALNKRRDAFAQYCVSRKLKDGRRDATRDEIFKGTSGSSIRNGRPANSSSRKKAPAREWPT